MQTINIPFDLYSSQVFWSELFRSIYNSYTISYVINKKRVYVNYEKSY